MLKFYLFFDYVTKESWRISQRFVWTPCSCAMATIQQTLYKYIQWETAQAKAFCCTHSNMILTHVTQLRCHGEVVWKHLEKIISAESQCMSGQSISFFCGMQVLQNLDIFSVCDAYNILGGTLGYAILDIFDIFIKEWSVKYFTLHFFQVYVMYMMWHLVCVCILSWSALTRTNCEKQLRTSINLFFFLLFKYI